MPDQKKFNVSLYQARHQNDALPALVRDLIGRFVDVDTPVIHYGDYRYKLLVVREGVNSYRGELKRFGHDDLPHAGTLDGAERELELDDEEMTIERNYFLFFPQRRLVVWQENRRACSVAILGRYLSDVLGTTITFDPVLTPDAARDMLLERYPPKVLDFTVARPLNPDMYDPNDDSGRVMRLLAGLGGLTGSFRISANATGMRGRLLNAVQALQLCNAIVQSGHATKVQLELDGIDHPIDLLMDRLRAKITVEMLGRYPVPASIYAGLWEVKDSFNDELIALFG